MHFFIQFFYCPIVMIAFLLDIIFSFNTALYREGKVFTNKSIIAYEYLTNLFFFDFMAVFIQIIYDRQLYFTLDFLQILMNADGYIYLYFSRSLKSYILMNKLQKKLY